MPAVPARPAFAKTDILAFDELSPRALYEVLRLRSAVFVVEQDCAYQDLDGLDERAGHVLVPDARGLVAYARVLPPGTAHGHACALGRVITAAAARGEGLGRHVVRRGIDECRRRWPAHDVVIHAQTYLLRFYRSLGFAEEGAEFLEDGLPHIAMRLAAS